MKTILVKEVVPVTSGRDKTTHYEVVEHNGKKFLIYIEGSNGDCLGFNSKCCLSVMTSDGTWKHVVDNRELGFSANNDGMYYGSDIAKKRNIVNNNVQQFKDYIETIY
jgi:hypothetical protein